MGRRKSAAVLYRLLQQGRSGRRGKSKLRNWTETSSIGTERDGRRRLQRANMGGDSLQINGKGRANRDSPATRTETPNRGRDGRSR
ncbi:unnamed protein product [Cuscuta campestris]|uniref:Uncharacterized protein n=1 Tax=Cuscuta campestris TaxID=132261 RepID=A0A484L6Y7_9ASTE|nr:unnamed protein product [Cuscuta campestris]